MLLEIEDDKSDSSTSSGKPSGADSGVGAGGAVSQGKEARGPKKGSTGKGAATRTGDGGRSDTNGEGQVPVYVKNSTVQFAPSTKPIRIVPRRYTADQLVRGTLVYYCGQPYWVENAPLDWSETSYVRISDVRIKHGQNFDLHPLRDDRISHQVHADCLELAPPTAQAMGQKPQGVTMAKIATAERAKAGIRDIGDEVATLLRKCETLDDVYKAAAKFLAVPESELRARYGKLNNGQQRMNLGNKMRHKLKKSQS